MSWTVYILKCIDETLYTGITTDVERRISEHESGKGARYTRGRKPFQLVYKEFCENRAKASQRELEIKALSRGKKIALIAEASNSVT